MKKTKLVFCIMLFLLLAIVFLIYYICIALTWKKWDGTYVFYGGMLYSSNEQYNGIIDLSEERVSISDRLQKEISGIDIKECYPDQIVLGKTTYFLLYRQSDGSGDAKIVQYDAQSVKKREYMAQNTSVLNYKNGYLFMGNRKGEGEDSYGFYANNYIKEEDFGQQPQQLKQDDSRKSILGNIELYYHKDGYFSTEPSLNDYPGLSSDSFRFTDKNFNAETKQEIKNRRLLLSEIGNIRDAVYEVFEYQMGNDIYGLCNVYEEGKYIPSLPQESKDVKTVYFYKISPKENKISILLKKSSCLGLILSNYEAVYQEGSRIIHYDFQTGKEKEIYQINNEHNLTLYIKKDYLIVIEEKKRILAAIFPTNESVYSVIKWKNFLQA